MGEVREWWANVYAPHPVLGNTGCRCPSREAADAHAETSRYARIHVRLKPEGAPKRYANFGERYLWEKATHMMQITSAAPRTPKIEERT
jgi:hypothetical protein